MANFAGILSLRAVLRLQSGVFPINRWKKNGTVQCAGSRDYGSSFPVRYVPKKSSRSDEEEKSPPTKNPEEEEDICSRENANDIRLRVSAAEKWGVAKAISPSEKLRDSNDKWNHMNSIVIGSSLPEKTDIEYPKEDEVPSNDRATGSSYWEMEDEMSHDQESHNDEFMKGPVELVDEFGLDEENICKPGVLSNDKTRKDAEDSAVRLLSTRAYTAVELKKKLHGKKFSPAIVDAVIDDFQRRGLVNDILYAETFSQSRWSASCWGPRRIKQELLRKGVSGANVDKAVRQVFEGREDSNSEGRSSLGLSKDSLDRLFVQASKQWLQSQGVPIENRKSGIIRWLQYRGFNWGVTSIILRRLESQESSDM